MMTHNGSSRRAIEEKAFATISAARRADEARWLAHCRVVSSRCSPWLVRSATEPRLLLLDELSMGLAPIVVEELYGVVRNLAADGVTVVVVEQFAEFALSVATWAVVMTGGRAVHSGTATEVAGSLHDMYLGTGSSNGKPRKEGKEER